MAVDPRSHGRDSGGKVMKFDWGCWMRFSLQVLVWRTITAKPTTRDSILAKEGEFPISQCRTFLTVCCGRRLW